MMWTMQGRIYDLLLENGWALKMRNAQIGVCKNFLKSRNNQ